MGSFPEPLAPKPTTDSAADRDSAIDRDSAAGRDPAPGRDPDTSPAGEGPAPLWDDSLPVPLTEPGRQALAALLADPGKAVVGLDFDGTLAPIVADPEQARAHPGAVPALTVLAPRLGGVAVITGRPAAVAVHHGGFAGAPGLDRLDVLGHYGAERWEAATGEVTAPPVDPGVAAVRAELPDVLRESGDHEGVWVEEKGRAVAVHTRRAADPDAAFEALRVPLAGLAARHGLALEPGRLVLELRPAGMDKGVALKAYLKERGARTVLYAGDDLGDLAAFDAVAELREQGVAGLLVCSSSAEVTALADRADLVVDGPAGVVALLQALGAATA